MRQELNYLVVVWELACYCWHVIKPSQKQNNEDFWRLVSSLRARAISCQAFLPTNWGRDWQQCDLTPQSRVHHFTTWRVTIDQWLCGLRVLHYLTVGLQIIRSFLPCSCIALQVLVCRTRSLDTQDFKMAKYVMLSVVLLSFLNLSSCTHVKFMDCGKLAGLICFLAIFLPRSLPLYDHVTVIKSPVTSAHEIEWRNRGGVLLFASVKWLFL